MKMRVRGYENHRLRDPYKFWSKLLDNPPKRSRRCIMNYTYVTRIDDETLEFYTQYGDENAPKTQLCLLTKNDTWTVTIKPEKVMPGMGNRLHALCGLRVGWNRFNYGMYENPCRIGPGYTDRYPYVPGVQVRKGDIVDKHKYVDKKRVIDEAVAPEIRKKLKKIYELAPIMIRLLEADGDRKPAKYHQRHQIKEQLYKEFDPDNVTAMDAERVYLLGEATTSRKNVEIRPASFHMHRFTPAVWGEEPIEEYRKRCVVNGLRKLREHIYSQEGVYQYHPVKKTD